MNPSEKINQICQEIQSSTVESFGNHEEALLNKIEEIKELMVTEYENNDGLNKYMIRLPLWLIDINRMNFLHFLEEKDRDMKTGLLNNLKRITNNAVELFEKACTENRSLEHAFTA
ncbi:MAG TPA: hypothetical protein VG870_02765 [Chitinophagaceae bacterium]|nr:hypothetical protein [Chitinophagaceae bacterium]